MGSAKPAGHPDSRPQAPPRRSPSRPEARSFAPIPGKRRERSSRPWGFSVYAVPGNDVRILDVNKALIEMSGADSLEDFLEAEEKYKDDEIDIVLHYFVCTINQGELILSEHEAIEWVAKEDFDQYDFVAGDGNITSLL